MESNTSKLLKHIWKALPIIAACLKTVVGVKHGLT